MKKYRIRLDDRHNILDIGTCGENNTTIFCFEIEEWKKQFGDGGIFNLLMQKPKVIDFETIEVEDKGDCVHWVVDSAALDVPGMARVQLIYKIDDRVIKSRIFEAKIKKGMD